jgi:hypothetical protein
MRFLGIIITLILFTACQSGKFACPEPETVRLKKKADVNYKVLIARHRAQPKKITKTELRQLQVREEKSVAVEEWDCPRPGVKNTPKQVQEAIRKNRKKFETHYRNREAADSVVFPVTTKQGNR